MFEPCPTCGGSGHFDPANTSDNREYGKVCPTCEGRGRVVSESVIEEMGRALQQMWEADAERDEDPYEWNELTEDEKEFWRTWAWTAGRVVLEHMEDNERKTG